MFNRGFVLACVFFLFVCLISANCYAQQIEEAENVTQMSVPSEMQKDKTSKLSDDEWYELQSNWFYDNLKELQSTNLSKEEKRRKIAEYIGFLVFSDIIRDMAVE